VGPRAGQDVVMRKNFLPLPRIEHRSTENTHLGQLHAPVALTAGEERRYPLDRRLGGPQSRSGCGD
jgi:hypothetical protein